MSDRGRCDNIASVGRVFVTHVIQLGVTHVLPLRLPTPRRFCASPMFYLAYYAIVARMTAKLKMNPVNAMNLDSSYRSGPMSFPPKLFQADADASVDRASLDRRGTRTLFKA